MFVDPLAVRRLWTALTPGNARRAAIVATVLAVVAAAVVTAVASGTTHRAPAAGYGVSARVGWRAGWRAAPQPPRTSGPAQTGFADQTVRMIVRSTVGGRAVRLRLSNAYGMRPLLVGDVTVGEQQRGAATASQHVVSFADRRAVSVAAGDEVVSDPVAMTTWAGEHLTVSLYLPVPTGLTTWHARALTTSYVASGDRVAARGPAHYRELADSWFFMDGVDVLGPLPHGVVVTFGDSITDGSTSRVDAYHTYPDWLADRLGGDAVLNEGIAGNRILTDSRTGGESALHRFDRDALDQPGVTAVVFLEGINDIVSGNASAGQLIAAMRELIGEAHASCITIIGGTITPFAGSADYTAAREQVRETVNRWIRSSGAFDGVADFDAAIEAPSDPTEIDPRYHLAGNLHPDDAGYRVMAGTIDPALLHARRGCTR